jgi:hypothetical protein
MIRPNGSCRLRTCSMSPTSCGVPLWRLPRRNPSGERWPHSNSGLKWVPSNATTNRGRGCRSELFRRPRLNPTLKIGRRAINDAHALERHRPIACGRLQGDRVRLRRYLHVCFRCQFDGRQRVGLEVSVRHNLEFKRAQFVVGVQGHTVRNVGYGWAPTQRSRLAGPRAPEHKCERANHCQTTDHAGHAHTRRGRLRDGCVEIRLRSAWSS